MPLPSSQRVFFMHVMKTGGTSFGWQLTKQFQPEQLSGQSTRYPVDSLQHRVRVFGRYLSARPWAQMTEADARRIRLYMGHLPAVAADLLPARPVMVTVLRHPINRTLSWLRHCKRYYPEHRDRSFEEIYEDTWWTERFVTNHQVKMLSMTMEEALVPTWQGVVPTDQGELFDRVLLSDQLLPGDEERFTGRERDPAAPAPELFGAKNLFELFGPNTHLVAADEQRLARALEVIDGFDIVGLTSRLPSFMKTLRDRLSWDLDTSTRLHRGQQDERVSEAFRRRIMSDNALDAALYSYVRHRLEARKSQWQTNAA
jgi:hypothetical protein